MVIELYPLTHVAISVNDSEAAYKLLNKTLEAEKIQEELAKYLGGEGSIVIHVGLGDTVFQFTQFKIYNGSWSDQMKNYGPGVHNITFEVDDLEQTDEEFKKIGIKRLITIPFDFTQGLPPEIVKPKQQPVIIYDTMEQIGFHLELYESPVKKEFRNNIPRPKYPTEKETLIGKASPMVHIELVTPDAEETYKFLHDVFGSEKVEIEFAEFLDISPVVKVIHVNLSNVVLQYIQPVQPIKELPEGGPWYKLLKKVGNKPYVHNITFLVENIQETAEAFKDAGVSTLVAFPLEWEKLVGTEHFNPGGRTVHIFDTQNTLGFHLELFERMSKKEMDFIFTDNK